eukprot:g6322.t1
MKRAVSSVDAWGARESAGADHRVVRLKRCKSAFANLKHLGSTSTTHAPEGGCGAAGGGGPPIFASDRMTGDPGTKGSIGPRWRQLFAQERQHESPTMAIAATSTTSCQVETRGGSSSAASSGSISGGGGPFTLGSAAVGHHQHRQQGAVSAAATERRLMFSGGSCSSGTRSSSSSSSSISPRRDRIATVRGSRRYGFGGGHGGDRTDPSCSGRHSFVSSTVSTCSTVPEQYQHDPSWSSWSSSSISSSAAARSPFLQQQQQHHHHHHHELQQAAGGGVPAPVRRSSGGEAVGFCGWMAEDDGGAGGSHGFSIVGFADVDDAGASGASEGEEMMEEYCGFLRSTAGSGSSCSSWATSSQQLPPPPPPPQQQQQQQQEQLALEGDGEGEGEEENASPVLLVRLQRRFEEMLVSNVSKNSC